MTQEIWKGDVWIVVMPGNASHLSDVRVIEATRETVILEWLDSPWPPSPLSPKNKGQRYLKSDIRWIERLEVAD